jgi:hypothetical protein
MLPQTSAMEKATALRCFYRLALSAAPAIIRATFKKSAAVKVANVQ